MQRNQSPLTLILTASAFAFTSPAHAQSKPYYVGEGTALRQAADRFERYLTPLATQESNGASLDHGDFVHMDKIVFPAGEGMGMKGMGPGQKGKDGGFVHVDKIVFPAGEGMGMKGIGPGQTGSCGGGIEDGARRRMRERVAELAEQPIPVRWKDVQGIAVVILDAQVDAALADLEAAAAGILPQPTNVAGDSVLTGILPHPTNVAENAFEELVKFHVDRADERQAWGAEDLVFEFEKALEADVERMRNRKATRLEQTWLLLTEFRMNVERVRARKAIEAGASPEPAMHHFARLFLQRQRLAKGVGIAN